MSMQLMVRFVYIQVVAPNPPLQILLILLCWILLFIIIFTFSNLVMQEIFIVPSLFKSAMRDHRFINRIIGSIIL